MAEFLAADNVLKRSMRRQRVFLDRLNPLELARSEDEVKERYRFYTPTIYSILRLIIGYIDRPTFRSSALPPLVILCCALRFFATGSYYTVLGDCSVVSKASVCRSVDVVTQAICQQAGNFIKWPTPEGLEKIKEKYYEVAGNE